MAIVQNPLIGRSRNKVAGTVFSKWKGRNVLRSKPDQVANPNTVAQQRQRSVIRQLVAIGRPVLAAIRYGFASIRATNSEWAEFMRVNANEAFTGTAPTATFVPANLTVSRGTLVNPADLDTDTPSGQDVGVSWSDDSGTPGANATDVLMAVGVKDDGSGSFFVDTARARVDDSATVEFPAGFTPADCHLYLFFRSAAGDDASDSVPFAI